MRIFQNKLMLLGILSFLTLTTYGERYLTVDKKNLLEEELDLTPFLYLIENQQNKTILFSDTADRLAVNQSYLFKFHLKNSTLNPLTRAIQFGERYVVAHSIQLQFLTASKQETIQGPVNTVAFHLMPGEELVVYFKMKELDRINPRKLAVRLFNPEELQRRTQRMFTTQAFFLGLLGFLCVFNLIIFFVTGWKLYLKYVLYIFCALVYFLYYYGFWQDWFPVTQQIPLNLIYTWYSLIFISYFIFLNDFGNYKEYVPRAHQLLNIGIVFKSVETILISILHVFEVDFIYHPVYTYSILVFEMILMAMILFYIIKNKSIQGRLIILASLFLISGAVLEQLKIIPNVDPALFAQLGITCELLTFSAGLGYLTKRYYQEKRTNQQLYIEQLKENEKIQKALNERLEEKVKQRTIELEIEKQLVEQKNKENELLIMEIHHRVKNNLQMIISLLNMQERTAENEETRKALLSGKERIRAIELIHKMLYSKNDLQYIEMQEYITNLVQYSTNSYTLPNDQIEVKNSTLPINIHSQLALPLGLILNELITNSCKHVSVHSQKLILSIMLAGYKDNLVLVYKDNGDGKPEDLRKQGSLGFKIISILVKQLNAEMEISAMDGLEYRIVVKNYTPIIQA